MTSDERSSYESAGWLEWMDQLNWSVYGHSQGNPLESLPEMLWIDRSTAGQVIGLSDR